MTMEDRSGELDRAAPGSTTTSTSSDASYPVQRASKRSFDVAFLVAPDENLARRQSEKLRLVSTERLVEDRRDDLDVERSPQNLTIKHYDLDRQRSLHCTENSLSPPYTSRLTPTLPGLSPEPEVRRFALGRSQKSPSPPSFICQQSVPSKTQDSDSVLLTSKPYDPVSCSERTESRSAFTKVSLAGQRNGYDESQTSPRSSISPDHGSYRSSVSPPVGPLPTPPTYKYATFPTKMPYPFLVGSEGPQGNLLENLKIPQVGQPPKVPSPKVPAFRPELPPVYPNLPYSPISVFPPMADALARPRFLATAGVAGLIPPSFAALTLPAQNVCAKCNLSFRMTSDLVYHMRSHHKNENAGEAARRRREEKLRCPVCDESFRERHHLTRHMTAHQDKESDAIADQVEVKRRAATVHGK
ncbi:Krueppel-like factor 10 [Orussus abietinus]|uniref:Krueppel-like factor 10 n=1 Tax=Orussus abietinus TaxID=222816 RepID=UPI0006255AF6|nr:Krueppel-like factor 10 [Orussus abietinus]